MSYFLLFSAILVPMIFLTVFGLLTEKRMQLIALFLMGFVAPPLWLVFLLVLFFVNEKKPVQK